MATDEGYPIFWANLMRLNMRHSSMMKLQFKICGFIDMVNLENSILAIGFDNFDIARFVFALPVKIR